MPTPRSFRSPCLVVHGVPDLDRAIGATHAAGLDGLCLLSAPAAGCFLGPAWWLALMRIAVERAGASGLRVAHALDCDDDAGAAMEALRIGQPRLVLAPSPQWNAVAARARACGATLLRERPPALDLAEAGAPRRLPGWLAAGTTARDDSATGPG